MLGSPQRKGRVELNTAAPAHDSSALPDDVLVAVFALLPLEHRHRSLPQVCRRWLRLVNSPPLLASLTASLGSPDHPRGLFLPRLRSFVRWLRCRAAPHLAAVHLRLHVPEGASRSGLRLAFAELKEALALDCTGLTRLKLELNQETRASEWLAQLKGLRSLHLSSEEGLRLSAQLAGLASCQELVLGGRRALRLAPDAQLPAGLTRLTLAGDRGEALPPQVAELTGLACLTLSRGCYTTAGLMPLSRLTRLDSLALIGCQALPPTAALTRLTALKALTLQSSQQQQQQEEPAAASTCGGSDSGWQEAVWLQAVLQGVTQLTLLRFSTPHRHASFPPALAGLHRLTHFEWGAAPPARPRLPVGPWLARLRHVALPASVAASSLAVLSAAWKLQELEAAGVASGATPPLSEIVRWAARHPPVQRLTLLLTPGGSSTGGSDRGSPTSSRSSGGSGAVTSRSSGSNGGVTNRGSGGSGGVNSLGSRRGLSRACSGASSGSWGSEMEGGADMSLEDALKEAEGMKPALVVRCA